MDSSQSIVAIKPAFIHYTVTFVWYISDKWPAY